MIAAAPTRHQLARAAGWYAGHGWAVFPIVPNTKRPAVRDWETSASCDPDQVAAAWTRDAFNIGIACGPSGLLVVDLDRPKDPADVPPPTYDAEAGIRDGADVLAALAEAAGHRYPDRTHTVATGSGGMHLYFTQPAGLQLRNTTGRLGWKVDTRGHGGYVIAAGSVVDGHRYRTLNTTRPTPLPNWLTTALTTPRDDNHGNNHGDTRDNGRDGRPVRDGAAYAHAALRDELDRVLTARPGRRNTTLNAAAYALGQLTAAGLLDRHHVTAALTVAGCHIGLGQDEAAATIASGLDAGTDHPRRTAG